MAGSKPLAHQFIQIFESPIGKIRLGATDEQLVALDFLNDEGTKIEVQPNAITNEAAKQLSAYFDNKLKEFDLPLGLGGTDFQHTAWMGLCTIPYGVTISYLDLAKRIGNTKAIRAVGAANGRNPISIIVPCHRVIGANGKLVGYGGGLWRKKWLLEKEGALPTQLPF